MLLSRRDDFNEVINQKNTDRVIIDLGSSLSLSQLNRYLYPTASPPLWTYLVCPAACLVSINHNNPHQATFFSFLKYSTISISLLGIFLY